MPLIDNGKALMPLRSLAPKGVIASALNRFGFVVIVLFMTCCMLYVFYNSPLRTRIENKFYDIRTRLASTSPVTSNVIILAIDESTLIWAEHLWPHPEVVAFPKAKTTELSYAALAHILSEVLKTSVFSVAAVLPPYIFDYQSRELESVATLLQKDPRLKLGLFDLNYEVLGNQALPSSLQRNPEQIFKADIKRPFRRDIPRDIIVSTEGDLPYLTLALAKERQTNLSQVAHKIKLNYLSPQKIPLMSAAEWLALPTGRLRNAALANKTVLIGYTVHREATSSAPEATFVNSPWQEEGYNVENGIPVITQLAITIYNLCDLMWLKPVNLAVNLLQTTIVALLTLGAWRFSSGFAAFLFIGGWCALLIMHSWLFSIASMYIPLADTALFSTLMMICGALMRLTYEGRIRAAREAQAIAHQEVASVQDRFLRVFAEELAKINHRIRECLTGGDYQLKIENNHSSKAAVAFAKATQSCEELEDYLLGIQHFAEIESHMNQISRSRSPQLLRQELNLHDLVTKTLSQFDIRIKESHLKINLSFSQPCLVLGDGPLIAQILYNLFSNAIKYSPEGKQIWITGHQGELTTILQVRDEGPGIDPILHQKIFEKFYRVKDDYVYKLKGHGLGLYLSRYFAQLIEADIVVDSQLGQGSTFSFELRCPPRAQKSESDR